MDLPQRASNRDFYGVSIIPLNSNNLSCAIYMSHRCKEYLNFESIEENEWRKWKEENMRMSGEGMTRIKYKVQVFIYFFKERNNEVRGFIGLLNKT